MNCPKCGNRVGEKDRSCGGCGTVLPASAGAVNGVSAADVSTDTPTVLGDLPELLSGSLHGFGEALTLVGSGQVAEASAADPGAALRERYEVLSQLGAGGFAVVYKARDRKLERVVAIKRLLARHQAAADSSQIIQRFLRESQTIASLNHRNIVAVYDCDEDAEGHFIVMEYVDGLTLRDYLKEHGRLPLEQAIRLVCGIAQGLSYAHRRKLVHRDIKPANILLARDEDELIPKIVDFGLARTDTTSEISETGMGMGTPYYMPPEQRRDAKSVNQTADIYALGKVLYELVTGDLPDNIHPGKVPPPPRLTEIILKCVESRPEDRYFTADDLRRSLESLLATVGKESAAPAAPAAADGAVCAGCGVRNSTVSRFCVGCGRDLHPVAANEESSHRQVESLDTAWQRRDVARMEEALSNLEKLGGVSPGPLESARQRVALARRLSACETQLNQIESACNHGRWPKAAGILAALGQALVGLAPEEGPAGDWTRAVLERYAATKEGFDASCTAELRREVLELTKAGRHPEADRVLGSISDLPVPPEVRDPLRTQLSAAVHQARLEQLRQFFDSRDWDRLRELGHYLRQAHPTDTQVNELLEQAQLQLEVGDFSAKAWKLFQNRQYREALIPCGSLIDMGAAAHLVNAPDAAGCTCGELAARVKAALERVQRLTAEIAAARGRNRWNKVEKLGLEYLELLPGDQAMLEVVNQCRTHQRKQGKLLRLAAGLLVLLAVVAGYHVWILRLERQFRQARESGKAEQALGLARRVQNHYVPAAKFVSDYEVAVAARARAQQMYNAIVDPAGGQENELLPKNAVAGMAAAELAFAGGQYEDAAGAWESAVLGLVKARPVILGGERIAKAESEYAAALQQVDVPLVVRWAAEPWTQAQADAFAARRLGRDMRWQEAADTWRRAAATLVTAQAQAIVARNQSALAAMVARGENLLKENRFDAAVGVFQEALKLPGAGDSATLPALLAKAVQGKENARPKETTAAAEPVKVAAPGRAAVATRTADAAREVVLTVKAKNADGEKFSGAIVWIDGVRQNEPAPFAFKLAAGRCHLILLEPPAAATEFRMFATLWSSTGGAASELTGVLDRHLYSSWSVPGSDLKLKWIPPGDAQLGSTADEQRWATAIDVAGRKVKNGNSFGEEGAEPRRLRVSSGFWLGQTEVTVGQWRRFAEATGYRSAAEKAGQAWCYDRVRKEWGYVTGKNWKDPGYALDVQESNPVVCVTGDDVAAFCRWLTETERNANRVPTGWAYRLPAEFEWEYACRGGSVTRRFWWGEAWEDGKGRLNGASNDKLGFSVMGQSWKGAAAWSDGFAWASPVDYFAARGRNGFDLADMLGNVGEWCADTYDPGGAHDALHLATASGAKRVVRGGSFYCSAAELRNACRFKYNPTIPYADVGFRVCLGPAFME